ncbi:MAG: hypothetical protein JWR67_174 [Mucilaginibacter sp.]|nr:hypothetical protein [Mucilaginibacter sp.]
MRYDDEEAPSQNVPGMWVLLGVEDPSLALQDDKIKLEVTPASIKQSVILCL